MACRMKPLSHGLRDAGQQVAAQRRQGDKGEKVKGCDGQHAASLVCRCALERCVTPWSAILFSHSGRPGWQSTE
jgi:hypothetical protein